jgi:tetratricopeptide (TPR) repeat protein
LDYPGFTQFEHDEKRREVEQLLKRQRVLLVLDNSETVTDGALLTWLLNLPEPSKALITSREKHRALWSSWLVELRGMSNEEAQTLIAQRLQSLQLSKIAGDLAHFEPLITVTGGNPKAIEMTLGLVKYERRPLQQVVDDLYAARGNLFDDLFARAWGLLDEAARRVLLVATFFPASASAEALSATADVQGFVFDQAIERLADLALLDVQQENLSSPARYALHPLVRAFAGVKLTEQQGFEEGARKKWVDWYKILTGRVGYCWNDNDKLDLLESEEITIMSAAEWAIKCHLFEQVIQLAKGSWYYFFVRGYWNESSAVMLLSVNAAQQQGDVITEIWSLAIYTHLPSRQGNPLSISPYLDRMERLANIITLPPDIISDYKWSVACYWMAQDELEMAEDIFCQALAQPSTIHPRIVVSEWLGICLYRLGKKNEAASILEESLRNAITVGSLLDISFVNVYLARIELEQGNIISATKRLSTCYELVYTYRDQEAIALLQHNYARLHTLRGDIPAAHAALAEAIDLFERLGMRRELAEARADLARLDAPDAPPTGASGAADLSGGDDHSSGPAPA